MQRIYNIFITLMIFGMKIGASFNYKLKRGLAGRRQSCDILKSVFSETDRVIWMHAASLGEYEQGLPVLESLKNRYPHYKILITFFSPSGYEVVAKKNTIADAVCYLPFDKPAWINEFLSNFKPIIFFTVKYEYWYNLLQKLNRDQVKIYVISSLFYERQIFFKPYGKWFVRQLRKNVDWFFHQTNTSYALAKTIKLDQSSISGDTRYDRVRQIKERDPHVNFISEFKGAKPLLVFGSSWETEEEIAVIVSAKLPELKIIIAPHDLKRVEHLQHLFPNGVLYSETTVDQLDFQVMIIDSVGLLSKIYSYADLAFVGGGFHSAGLHNILEAATFGTPVLFGNRYQKNPEADDLIRNKGGASFIDENYAADFILKIMNDKQLLEEMGKNAGDFINSQPNSTELIMKKITSDLG
ncbi:MAG: 3-deoxy-D-manno-octulosonic acid transferase [Chryseobacterium sp.]|nr:3-deoxy-D-manno-octulosonic acid transferase [Chryseobacterium sp.]